MFPSPANTPPPPAPVLNTVEAHTHTNILQAIFLELQPNTAFDIFFPQIKPTMFMSSKSNVSSWSTDFEVVKNIDHKAPSHDLYHSCREWDKNNKEISMFPYRAEDFS